MSVDKGSAVRDLFDRIAARYDLANTAMTAGIDELWRRQAVGLLQVANDGHLLDLCCGTGALSRDLARIVPEGLVDGVDFSAKMLEVARARRSPGNIVYHQADVLALPFPNDFFDGAAMGYSLRNIVDVPACLREITRVLKPGASFVNLEVSKPPNPMWRRLFYAYFYRVAPVIGRVAGGDAPAYRYLPQSLVNFPDADGLAELFKENGFAHVRYVGLFGGAAALHIGTKERVPVTGERAASLTADLLA